MVNQLMALPGYQVGGQIDFSMPYNALDSNARMNQQQSQFNQQNALAQNHLALAQRRDDREGQLHGFNLADREREREKADAKDWAGFFNYVKTKVPPDQQQAVWASRWDSPRYRGREVPDEVRNFATAGPRLMSAAADYMGPQELAQMGLVEAKTAEAWATARAAGSKSQFDGVIANLLSNSEYPAPPAGQPGPGGPPRGLAPTNGAGAPVSAPVQPRSLGEMAGGSQPGQPVPQTTNRLAQFSQPMAPGTGRNSLMMSPAGGGTPSPALPQPPPMSPPPQTYQTGLGPMTRDRVQRVSTGLALAGKTDAAKMVADSVNLDPEFTKAMSKKHAEIIQTYIEEGDAGRDALADFSMMKDLNGVIGSGAWESWKPTIGPWAQSFGINISGLSEAQTFQAIANKIAPNMRPKGSGSSSDRDMAIFINSIPQLSQTRDGRMRIIDTFEALNQYRIERADIANQIANGQLTRQQGTAMIRELASPFARAKESYRLRKEEESRRTGQGNAAPTGGEPRQGAPTGTPSQASIQHLRSNANDPRMLQMFEETYGPGSARQFLQQRPRNRYDD